MTTPVLIITPKDPENRGDDRRFAEQEVARLARISGREHRCLWNKYNQSYEVFVTEFKPLEKPWDEENRPQQRRTDWDIFPTHMVALGDMLLAAANLNGSQWMASNEYPNDPAQFVKDLQAALDLQYGRGRYWATRHGSRISVQCRFPFDRE